MRIIKLSSSDPDMSSIEAVHEYFNEKLANRKPQGQFLLTKGKIKPDGLFVGEFVVFTYKAQLVYIVAVNQEVTPNTGSDKKDYPSYFCIDLTTLIPCTGSLKEFNRQLVANKVTNKNFGGQGWVQVPDVEENLEIENLLDVFITDSQNPLVTSKLSKIVVRVGQQKFRDNLKVNEEHPVDKVTYKAIKTRRGQPEFRQTLLSSFGGRCCVTGCIIEGVLEAAHIVPHSIETNYSITNGLLLRSDIHTLYDLNLIGIDGDGKVFISSALKESEYWAYHGSIVLVSIPANMSENLNERFQAYEKIPNKQINKDT